MISTESLFPDENPIRRACIEYRLRCISHRLRKFGFESSINRLTARELLLMTTLVYPHQADALRREALLREPALREVME